MADSERFLTTPLSAARDAIDEIDKEIAALLNRRAVVVDAVRAAKLQSGADTYDPQREEQVLQRVLASASDGRFPRFALRAVFREIISGCVALQEKLRVAFLGPEGSLTEVAALAVFGTSAAFRDVPTPFGVLDAVARQECAFGVIPFESSSEGLILKLVEGMVSRSLKIRREYVSSLAYALASNEKSLSEVRNVYGTPVQVGICRGWLTQHLPLAAVTSEETPMVAFEHAKSTRGSAVLVSKLAAERAGLNILAERANDRLDDTMRFLVVARTPADDVRMDKTAMVITPREGVSLAGLLGTFASHGVEVLRFASQPHPNDQWGLMFFAEVHGNSLDRAITDLCDDMRARFGDVISLGSYATHQAVGQTVPPPASPRI
jgi:chorismate mutase/prephenate dehydratase